MLSNKKQQRTLRTRSAIKNPERPRLSVFRSNRYLYAQVIDDSKQRTVVSCSDHDLKNTKQTKAEVAKQIGKLIAEKATKAKIKRVVFDRGPYTYHGRIKILADAAREAGLVF